MPVYVDKPRWKIQDVLVSHMMADTIDELHPMAYALRVSRKWFRSSSIPYYILNREQMQEAIKLGAVHLDSVSDILQLYARLEKVYKSG